MASFERCKNMEMEPSVTGKILTSLGEEGKGLIVCVRFMSVNTCTKCWK